MNATHRPLHFHPAVASDLREGIDWYENISIDLGNRFRAAANVAFDEISATPGRFPRAFADIRFARLAKFPYLVLFRESASLISIVGVFHSASDPKKWRRRAKDV